MPYYPRRDEETAPPPPQPQPDRGERGCVLPQSELTQGYRKSNERKPGARAATLT